LITGCNQQVTTSQMMASCSLMNSLNTSQHLPCKSTKQRLTEESLEQTFYSPDQMPFKSIKSNTKGDIELNNTKHKYLTQI